MPSASEPAAPPRGRTAAARPLAAAATTVTATTASTRAKQAAAGSSEKKPTTSLKESAADDATATPISKPEPNPASAKPKNGQSSTTSTAIKEPLKKSTSIDENTSDPHDSIKEADKSNPAAEQGNSSIEATEERISVQPQPQQGAQPTDLPPPSDLLQVAAQAYPWLYMNSTLEACFAGAEKTAHRELDEREKQLEEDEAQLTDEKFRYDSERMIEFCNELESDTFSKDAPAVMQSFISHGDECTRIEAEALELVATTPSLDSEEPLRAYNALLDNLDELQEQASKLESSILRLTESISPSSAGKGAAGEEESVNQEMDVNSARAQIIGVFAACLPVLRARIANLSMAQELIDSAQENLSLALRMESMGIE